MGIQRELVRQGNWLFRWRGLLPLAFLIPLAIGIATMRWPWGSYVLHEVWEFVALGVSVLGLVVRVVTVGHTPAGTSGRNTRRQVAEELNTTGVYSVVRHPLYLGNFLIGLGVALVPAEAWLAALYVLAFWLYYERIMAAEESYLKEKFGEPFEAWVARTPAFVPRLRNWTRPALPFSLRNALRREYTAATLIVACHTAIEVAEHLVIDHEFKLEPVWMLMLGAALTGYVVLRTLKRHTQLLHVQGR